MNPLAIARPNDARRNVVREKVYGFWAYDISDPENMDDVYYSFPTREEAEIAQDEMGDGTPIKESWQEYFIL